MMALSIALSVVATIGTGILLSSRIIYGMANYRALPGFLGNVSQRFSSPIAASVVVGVLLIALTWAYLLATSVQEAFSDVISVTGLLFATFYTRVWDHVLRPLMAPDRPNAPPGLAGALATLDQITADSITRTRVPATA